MIDNLKNLMTEQQFDDFIKPLEITCGQKDMRGEGWPNECIGHDCTKCVKNYFKQSGIIQEQEEKGMSESSLKGKLTEEEYWEIERIKNIYCNEHYSLEDEGCSLSINCTECLFKAMKQSGIIALTKKEQAWEELEKFVDELDVIGNVGESAHHTKEKLIQLLNAYKNVEE